MKDVLTILVFSIVFPASSQNKFFALYRDTFTVQNDYSISVMDTYIRGSLFLKSTVWIHNPTSSYLILDYTSAFAVGDDGVAKEFKNNENPVFLPGGSYKKNLKFKATSRGKYVSIHFPRVYVTDKVTLSYPPLDLPKIEGVIRKVNNISVEVLKIMASETEYKVRVRIRYDGDEFLAINFKNISVRGDHSGVIFNRVRPYHRMHHRKTKYLEMATLTFPIQPGEKLEKMLHFENVFFIYGLKELKGFDLNYTVRLNEEVDAPDEEEMDHRESKTQEE